MILENSAGLRLEENILSAGRFLCGIILLAALFDYFKDGSDIVIRASAIYLTLIIIFRIAGRKALSETTTADLVMLLIISETVQGALIQDDNSLQTALLLIISLVTLDFIFLKLKLFSSLLDRIIEGKPVRIVKNHKTDYQMMKLLHIEEEDILESARRNNEISSMDAVKEAIVEKNGDITILPYKK